MFHCSGRRVEHRYPLERVYWQALETARQDVPQGQAARFPTLSTTYIPLIYFEWQVFHVGALRFQHSLHTIVYFLYGTLYRCLSFA